MKLDNRKIKDVFGWSPKWHIDECVERVVRFTEVYLEDKKLIPAEMDKEIKDFFGDIK